MRSRKILSQGRQVVMGQDGAVSMKHTVPSLRYYPAGTPVCQCMTGIAADLSRK